MSVIKSTVAKNATDAELYMFIHLCNQYQLDPFKKEIWFIKYKDTPTIMTSRDGYLKIAQSHPDFLGLQSQEVRANDYFERDPENGMIKHRFASPLSNRGEIVGAWAVVKRKGMDATSIFVNFEEYKGPSHDSKGKLTIWGKYPSAMIIKVAEAFVLKRAFSISGLVTREELEGSSQQEETPDIGQFQGQQASGWETRQPQGQKQERQQPPKQQPAATEEQSGTEVVPSYVEINALRRQIGWSTNQMWENIRYLLKKYSQANAKKWEDISPAMRIAIYQTFENKLHKIIDQMGGRK